MPYSLLGLNLKGWLGLAGHGNLTSDINKGQIYLTQRQERSGFSDLMSGLSGDANEDGCEKTGRHCYDESVPDRRLELLFVGLIEDHFRGIERAANRNQAQRYAGHDRDHAPNEG